MTTHHVFNVRFPAEMWERAYRAALAERRSMNQWVLMAVQDALDVPPPAAHPFAAVDTVRAARAVANSLAKPHNADPKDKAAQEHGRRERRPKSGLCPHRVAAGSFCKRCEEG